MIIAEPLHTFRANVQYSREPITVQIIYEFVCNGSTESLYGLSAVMIV